MYAATSASNAAASIRRAPSRTISSIGDTLEAAAAAAAGVTSGSATTVSMGVPSRPALARGPYSIPGLRTRREGTPPDLIHRFRALLWPRPKVRYELVLIPLLERLSAGRSGWSWPRRLTPL